MCVETLTHVALTRQVLQWVPDSSKFVGAGNRVIELLDMKPDIDANSPDGIKLGRAKGAIRFEVRHRICNRAPLAHEPG